MGCSSRENKVSKQGEGGGCMNKSRGEKREVEKVDGVGAGVRGGGLALMLERKELGWGNR